MMGLLLRILITKAAPGEACEHASRTHSVCILLSDYVRIDVLHVQINETKLLLPLLFSPLLSSLRLTAYVVKVFAMASNLVPVESRHICDAVKFLIHNAQQSEGLFWEVGRVSHRQMIVRALIS